MFYLFIYFFFNIHESLGAKWRTLIRIYRLQLFLFYHRLYFFCYSICLILREIYLEIYFEKSSDTYYLRDLFVPFPCDVELTVAAPITPAAASSLLDGFVSPPLLSGGSFLFSKGMYSAHYWYCCVKVPRQLHCYIIQFARQKKSGKIYVSVWFPFLRSNWRKISLQGVSKADYDSSLIWALSPDYLM